jgi:hypothetical protein
MAGMAAAGAMALFAMVACAVRGLGLYTPLYLVTAVVEPGPLETARQEAAAGWRFFLELGPGLAGLAVHLGIGAGYGAVFVLLARALRLRGPAALLAGTGYGLAVMALMALVVLPWAAGWTAGGQVIADAPDLLGWPVFVVEHLLYGLVLGIWTAVAGRDRAYAANRPTR